MSEIFAAVRACAIVMLAGGVLQAEGVSAGNGIVIDWRTVKSGETLQEDGDPFDTAHLFIALVGIEVAYSAATRDYDIPAAPPVVVTPTVHAYAPDPSADDGRRRTFTAGAFKVIVEPHENDEAQAAFTEKLAAFCTAPVG